MGFEICNWTTSSGYLTKSTINEYPHRQASDRPSFDTLCFEWDVVLTMIVLPVIILEYHELTAVPTWDEQ